MVTGLQLFCPVIGIASFFTYKMVSRIFSDAKNTREV